MWKKHRKGIIYMLSFQLENSQAQFLMKSSQVTGETTWSSVEDLGMDLELWVIATVGGMNIHLPSHPMKMCVNPPHAIPKSEVCNGLHVHIICQLFHSKSS